MKCANDSNLEGLLYVTGFLPHKILKWHPASCAKGFELITPLYLVMVCPLHVVCVVTKRQKMVPV